MSALGYKGDDPAAAARALVEDGRYMTLATADEHGRPWATPVWFAPHELRELYWVSSPDAGHSCNIRVRPEIAIVIFDSGAPVGTGRGVYPAATAAELAGAELERGIEIFSQRSLAQGARPWARDDVLPPARHRLYRATVNAAFVNDDRDVRTPVTLRP